MSAKHTPGRLARDTVSGYACDIRGVDDKRKVALCYGLSHPKTAAAHDAYRALCDANAHRLVNAWNACLGLDADDLKTLDESGGVMALAHHARTMERQLDNLLSALQAAVSAISRAASGTPRMDWVALSLIHI